METNSRIRLRSVTAICQWSRRQWILPIAGFGISKQRLRKNLKTETNFGFRGGRSIAPPFHSTTPRCQSFCRQVMSARAKTTTHEIRYGLIKATITVRTSKIGMRYSLSLVRLYRNGDCWKCSTRFGPDDLPVMRLVLDKAYGWILVQRQAAIESAATNSQ